MAEQLVKNRTNTIRARESRVVTIVRCAHRMTPTARRLPTSRAVTRVVNVSVALLRAAKTPKCASQVKPQPWTAMIVIVTKAVGFAPTWLAPPPPGVDRAGIRMPVKKMSTVPSSRAKAAMTEL